MTQLGYLDNSKHWTETTTKDGVVSPFQCVDSLTESLSEQTLKQSKKADLAKAKNFTGHYSKQRRQKHEDGLQNRGEGWRMNLELLSPVEDKSSTVAKTQNGSTPLKQNRVGHEGMSKPIDIVQSANGTSKMYGQCQRREFILEDAWERKREEKRSGWKNNKTQKLQGSGKGMSDGADSSKIGTSQEGKNCKSKTRSLTDYDFEELRGCIDLGFSFGQNYSPDLCDTLPALKVCYAIAQSYHDSQAGSFSPVSTVQSEAVSPSSPVSSWQICSPGDPPQQVKAKLRHWAQAVACTVRQSC